MQGILVACPTPRKLHNFSLWTVEVAGAAMLVQTWNLLKFWCHLRRALAVRDLAGSDAAVREHVLISDDVGEVANSLFGASVFLSYFLAWVIGAHGLKSLVDDGSTFIQVLLIGVMLINVMAECAWAEDHMVLSVHQLDNFAHYCTDISRGAALEGQYNGTTSCKEPAAHAATLLWVPVVVFCANDIRKMNAVNRLLELPAGKSYHFFICHHQASGGNQARILCDQLTDLGCSVWYDNAVSARERNVDGMRRGVSESVTLLIFLSGRKEKDGRADSNGKYQGVFTRWFCHEEIATARKEGLAVMGVMEKDERFGAPDIAEEKSRAMTCRDGGPVHEQAVDNIKLLDEVCFIPRDTQQHQLPGYLEEIIRQGVVAAKAGRTMDESVEGDAQAAVP